MRGAAAVALLTLAAAGCGQGPPEPVAIDTRNDACSSCRMAISDASFAAQLVAIVGPPTVDAEQERLAMPGPVTRHVHALLVRPARILGILNVDRCDRVAGQASRGGVLVEDDMKMLDMQDIPRDCRLSCPS